jgi:hypothetical protein
MDARVCTPGLQLTLSTSRLVSEPSSSRSRLERPGECNRWSTLSALRRPKAPA